MPVRRALTVRYQSAGICGLGSAELAIVGAATRYHALFSSIDKLLIIRSHVIPRRVNRQYDLDGCASRNTLLYGK